MKVIFLDIDGPMIPTSMFLVDRMSSMKRIFPPTTIAVINEICKRTEAKVVLNTTHNLSNSHAPDIEVALANHGFDESHFHEHSKTRYPAMSREEAVLSWLSENSDVEEWVALDDARFTDLDNLVYVDPNSGLTLEHANEVIDRFGGGSVMILV